MDTLSHPRRTQFTSIRAPKGNGAINAAALA